MNFSIGIYSCPMHPIHLVGLYTTRLPVFRWKARGYDWILVDSIGQPSKLGLGSGYSNSISWYGVFSVKKTSHHRFFFWRFRMKIFPSPVDIFSKKHKFCSSFIFKLGGPFYIKLSSKMFILISIFLFLSHSELRIPLRLKPSPNSVQNAFARV